MRPIAQTGLPPVPPRPDNMAVGQRQGRYAAWVQAERPFAADASIVHRGLVLTGDQPDTPPLTVQSSLPMRHLIAILCVGWSAFAQSKETTKTPAQAETPPAQEASPTADARRLELNLIGKTNTAAGESRRNENVQFNPVDNNGLKELNIRLGATATIVKDVRPERGYFSAEFGNPPTAVLHVPAFRIGFHREVWETHQNSVFSARSFFHRGCVKPAH